MRRSDWLMLGTAVAVGAAARFATLDLQSFHHDEAVQAARVLQPGLGDTLAEVADGERSPPLYYVLHWLWSKPFGTGEVGLRSLSALIGTLMIPAAFVAGRALLSVRAGLFAAAFVALNPLLVWYSQEARSYILMALLVTLSVAFFARLTRSEDGRTLALWALACSLALCSHYFAAFLVLPQVAYLLYAGPRPQRVVAACGAVALVALALLPFALEQQGEDRRDGFAELSLPGRIAEVGLDFSASEDPDPLAGSARVDSVQIVAGVGGGLLVLGLVGAGLFRGSAEARRAAMLAGGVALAGIGAPVAAAAVGLDFLKPRNVMAGAVPLLLAAAVGAASLRSARLGRAVATALCAIYVGVLVAVGSTAEMQREDWRGLAAHIGPAMHTRALAIPKNGDDPLAYYLGADRLGRDPVPVTDLVVVTTNGRVDPPSGFSVTDRLRLPPLFEVWRLRAPRPVALGRVEVERILDERAAALVDAAT